MATILGQLEGQGEHPGQVGSAPATPVRFPALPVGSVHHAVPRGLGRNAVHGLVLRLHLGRCDPCRHGSMLLRSPGSSSPVQ